MDQSLRVDYDRIAPTYGRRFSAGSRADTAAALTHLVQELEARDVLEVGCGTGHWLSLLPLTCQVYGVDLSDGMLRQAQKAGRDIRLCRGRAEELPFPDRSFDLIYCVNAIHHFRDARAFVHQARRLLRPGGALAVIGSEPRQPRDWWYVYDYFAGTYDRDLRRFPSWGTVMDWMVAAQFVRAEWRLVDQIHSPKSGREVLEDPFLQKDLASQLALLSDEEYGEGVRRIEMALTAAEAAGETLVFPAELSIHLLLAHVSDADRAELQRPE